MISTIRKEKKIKAKDLFNRDIKINIGDVVTTYDDSEEVEAYVVKSIDSKRSVAIICGLELSEEKDDVCIKETEIPINSLVYIGVEFINSNGYLWAIKERILKGYSCLRPNVV